jgi:hypothetical protein
MQGIYEDYCRRKGINKDDPVLFTMDKMRSLAEFVLNRGQDFCAKNLLLIGSALGIVSSS